MDKTDIEIMKQHLELYKLVRLESQRFPYGLILNEAETDRANACVRALIEHQTQGRITTFDGHGTLHWPEHHELYKQGNVLLKALEWTDEETFDLGSDSVKVAFFD